MTGSSWGLVAFIAFAVVVLGLITWAAWTGRLGEGGPPPPPPRPKVTRHLVEFGFDRWVVLEHPDGEDPADCPVPAMAERMRLEDGRMQVQGTYRETSGGTSYERVEHARPRFPVR